MTTEHDISEYIIHTVKTYPRIPGSDLGTFVRNKFPDVNFRYRPGKLRGFIAKECAGKIVEVERHGMDVIYSHIDNIDTQIHSTTISGPTTIVSPTTIASDSGIKSGSLNTSEGKQRNETTLWSAFTNPALRVFLFLHSPSQKLTIKDQETKDPSELPIPKLSRGDHLKFCQEFLSSLELSQGQRDFGTRILSQDNFWPPWYDFIKTVAGGIHFKMWTTFRFQKITSAFVDRLKLLQVQETLIPSLLKELVDSKPFRSKVINDSVPASLYLSPKGAFSQGGRMRNIVRSIIEILSEDDLRALRVPIGAVVDAIDRHNRFIK
jgi:hypothetical protein